MNQKHRSLDDAMFEPESLEASEQVNEIERRLKATRPQPPRLDLAALQQLADEAAVSTVVELPVDRKFRRMMVIAGSWVCGAGVGALVMFFLMSRAAPNTNVDNSVVHTEQQTPEPTVRVAADELAVETDFDQPDDPSAIANVEQRRTGESVLTMAIDPLGYTDLKYSADGPTLRVGTYFTRTDDRAIWPFERLVERERAFLNDYDLGPSATGPNSTLTREAERPVSRRR